MKTAKIMTVLFVAIALAGCANLQEVRDYARESAKLSAYTELTTRFRDTYEREQSYLSGEADRLAQANDKRRKAAYDDLLKIHHRVSLYMKTLGALAGEETFELSKHVDELSGGIQAYPDFGIDEKHADAVTSISKLVTKWITSSAQERAVRDMIREGDPPLQTTLEGMTALVRYYRKTNDNEMKTVMGFFEVEIPFADSSKDKLLTTLARVHVQSRKVEFKNAQRKYDDAERGIKSIAEGHKRLLENIDKLSSDEVKVIISKCTREIMTISETLQTVRD